MKDKIPKDVVIEIEHFKMLLMLDEIIRKSKL